MMTNDQIISEIRQKLNVETYICYPDDKLLAQIGDRYLCCGNKRVMFTKADRLMRPIDFIDRIARPLIAAKNIKF